MNIRVPLVCVLTLSLATTLPGCGRPQQKRPIRDAEINAVIEAIQDEIYDLNREKYVDDIGTRSPNNRNQ